MQLENNLEITFTTDDIKDTFSVLHQNMTQVETSAKGVEEALRRLCICVYNKDKQEFKSAKDIMEELADKWNEIGCIHPATPDKISQALVEISNQNTNFNFLERNAYKEIENIFDGKAI